MKITLKILSIVLIVVIIIASLLIASIYFIFNGIAGNDIVKTEVSPDGKYKAVAFIRDGGATTDFSPQVSLLKIDKNIRNESGNIFRGYHSQYIDIKWEDASTLIIFYNCSSKDIFKQKTEYEGIKIKYNIKN